MFFRLKDEFALRGWQRLPHALVRRPTNSVAFVSAQVFASLELCDGLVDCSLPMVPQRVRDGIAQLVSAGVVEPCEYGVGLSADQRYRRYDCRFMQVAHWSVTGKCNYQCKHCYMSAPDAKFGELPHDQVMAIIDQFEECGVMQVSLTGGEPLVRRDFAEIVSALAAKRIWITQIYSNGFKVRPELLDLLEDHGFRPEFNMSYDGDVGWHAWLRGIPNAEQHVLDAFDLCYERGFPTGAEMCLHQGNKHLLRDSINTLAAHHCGSCKVNPVAATDAWREFDHDYSLTVEEAFDIYVEYVPHFFADGMPLSIMLGGLFACDKDSTAWQVPLRRFDGSGARDRDRDRETVCSHARNHLYISPEGRMLPCMSLSSYDVQYDYPLITDIGLQAGLSDSAYLSLVDTRVAEFLQGNAECGVCEHRPVCAGGCRASALAFDDTDILGTDRAACAIFKGGYGDEVHRAASVALSG